MYRWNTRKMSESERFAHMFDKSIGLVRKWSEIRVGPNELVDSDDDVLDEFGTLDSLVDDVMEAAAEVRKYYKANKGCFGEQEEYAKVIDEKMNFILSELF